MVPFAFSQYSSEEFYLSLIYQVTGVSHRKFHMKVDNILRLDLSLGL